MIPVFRKRKAPVFLGGFSLYCRFFVVFEFDFEGSVHGFLDFLDVLADRDDEYGFSFALADPVVDIVSGFAELVEKVREGVGYDVSFVILLFEVAAASEMVRDGFAEFVFDYVVDGFSEFLEFGILESGSSGHGMEKLGIGILYGVAYVLAEIAYGREVVFGRMELSRVHFRHRATFVELDGYPEQVPEVHFSSSYEFVPYRFYGGVYGLLAYLLRQPELPGYGACDVFGVDHAASC